MKNNKLWIVILIVVIVAVVGMAISKKDKKSTEDTSVINDTTVQVQPGTSSTGTTSSKAAGTKSTPSNGTTSTTTPSPIPPNTLIVTTPTGGEVYRTGQTMDVGWDSSVDLTGAYTKVTVKLMKNGNEIATLSDAGGVPARTKRLSWKVPDMSLWEGGGFTVVVSTSGLSKNLTAKSASFSLIK